MNTEFDVCDIVEYAFAGEKPSKWRISSFLKRVPAPEDMPPQEEADLKKKAVAKIIQDICLKSLEKDREYRKGLGLPHARRYKLVWCQKEEATHAELVAVCGAIVPLEELKKVGVVDWTPKLIEEQKERAKRYEKDFAFSPHYEWE